ncbi:MAG: hypothetical protein FIB08_01400 [Candidatus Methanoperedens sp.]|nr:hypothetical protein [Candidatus Methanoperedens sp.]
MTKRQFASGAKVMVKGTKETGTILGVDRETNRGYIEYSVRLDNPERFQVIPEKQMFEVKEIGDRIVTYPMPGDLVMIENSHDTLIANFSYGIIEGIIGEPQDEYLVCFNAYSTFRDTSVSASGGPAYMIHAKNLVDAKIARDWFFWKWKDMPRAGGGVPFKETCRIWFFDASKRGGAQ